MINFPIKYIKNNVLHREDVPAVEYANGHKEWWVNGELHREDGPAIEWTNGYKTWYIKGQRHRDDGPAVECSNGHKEWWVNDICIDSLHLLMITMIGYKE